MFVISISVSDVKDDSLSGIHISNVLCQSQLLTACRTYAVKLAM